MTYTLTFTFNRVGHACNADIIILYVRTCTRDNIREEETGFESH